MNNSSDFAKDADNVGMSKILIRFENSNFPSRKSIEAPYSYLPDILIGQANYITGKLIGLEKPPSI